MASEAELQDYYETALRLAQEAGKTALDAYAKDKNVEMKECSSDLVTETDKKVEEFLISSLRDKFPTHSFIGEETTFEGKKCELTDNPTWIIDPIDGTSNFVHRFPFSAICVGLTVNKKPIVGVVYNFILDQMFSALVGKGALMNGKPIHVSGCKEINRALVVSELGSVRNPSHLKPKIDTLYTLASEPCQVHGMRSLGSAALNACMVAQGSADAYFEYGIHCWDIAAAELIVREAGGVSVYPTGEPLDLMKRGILVAASSQLASQLTPHIVPVAYPSD